MDKMLQKGAMKLIPQPGPGFYNRLSLVQRATEVAARDGLVESERVRHPDQVHRGDSLVSPGVNLERGLCFRSTSRTLTSRSPSIRSRIHIVILLFEDWCTNSGHFVLAIPQLFRCLPRYSFWCWSGLIRG